ncbi:MULTISPECIES: hypothetical protein [unclassified Streptomyces]|uniref:hypothetical protein n=1 Tax=unclassified Streptomyces TaxID=2593676 RepID=UPI0038049F58
MTKDQNSSSTALEMVRVFLREYYYGEEWEDRAAIRALANHKIDRREHFRVASAFEIVLEGRFPEGVLQELVASAAYRATEGDGEAREFLERVYENNAFDGAVDPDEFA